MKRKNDNFTRISAVSGLAVLISFALIPVAGLVAQGTGGTGGGNTGGGNTGGNTQGQTGNQQVGTGQQTNTGGGTGQASQFNPSDTVDFGSILDQFVVPEIEQIESERLQPFVGASRSYFEEKQIPAHPRSQLAPGTGGGTGGGNSFGGFSLGGRNATGRAGQFGSQNGFTVPRLGVRARLNPQIVQTRPRINEQTAAANFQDRLLRIPATQEIASGISLTVSGGRAVLSGSVANDADKVRIERMARLEPGVYAIENRITVSGQ